MESSFWSRKWDVQQIGFHQNKVNPLLIKYWPSLNLLAGCEVFVPLCGKSLDMCYLTELGHKVQGCELSEVAAKQFFAENNLAYSMTPLVTSKGQLSKFDSARVTFYQGDIFTLTANELPSLSAFYDRAALIAWPESMRQAYVGKLAELLPPKSIGLLITLDYPQEAMKGPPFSVSDDWVLANMSDDFEVERLNCEDVLPSNPKFVDSQVPWLTESVYRLTRKG
ncbi:thiopurine S-methyltransferase [Shewanella sp. VB17]|uniref:thiopurine S-methyltransferase n=1 Tax=Shewanella sp. VB17 TaxID=2739432 RepID=UPI0015648684|nr:thiopurine S-methyltransferase [Shewanella sp. VB17]NRD72428.1 thiopurine S-methyltransferase [Shewanella sp. VB17]